MTAVLFFSGWIYLYEYYDQFGVDIWCLDLPAYASLSVSIIAISPMLGGFVRLAYIALIVEMVAGLMHILSRFFWFRAFVGKRLVSILHTVPPTLRNLRLANWLALAPDTSGQSSKKPGFRSSPDDFDTPTLATSMLTHGVNVYLILFFFTLAVIAPVTAIKLADTQAELTYKQPSIKTVLTFKTEECLLLRKEFLQINARGGLRLLVQTKDLVAVFVKRELQPHTKSTYLIPTANLAAVRNEPHNAAKQ